MKHKQLDIMENNWLNLINLLKKILIPTGTVYHIKNKKKLLNEFFDESSSEFRNLERKVNSDKLIYKYKAERRSPKGFSVYQNLIQLFKDLREGNIKPKPI